MSPISKKNLLMLLFLVFRGAFSFAQEIPKYIFDTDIVVEENGVELRNAWAGGLNFIQIETYDFNYDGKDDLLVFDRSGNKIMPFIFYSNNGVSYYKYDASYVSSFPSVINWIKLVDYNCDGMKDIFAFNILGIEVWKNITEGNNTKFEQQFFEYKLSSGTQMLEAIKTDTGSEYDTNLSIIYQDIPAIVDVDGDGNVDILNFGLGSAIPEGSTVEFHRNRAKCGLDFERITSCWGGFAENYMNNSVSLEVCNKPIDLEKTRGVKMHAGSSLLVSDFSGNGLPDMLIGDITFENAVMVFNHGDMQTAWMTELDDNYPNYSTPIRLEYFPGFSMIDIDLDGTLDLVASPAIKGSQNIESVWRYKNVSTDNVPVFELNNKSFLQDEMIDVGEGANPHLYDVDGDGLLDLLVGNYGYYESGKSYKSSISFYKNIGNATQPRFELVTKDFGNLSQYPWRNVYPTFGDINNDGITDMIVGINDAREGGIIHYFEGTGNNNFIFKYPNYLGVDVGTSALPNLTDVDGDGLLDLIIGNKKGTLHFYRNIGTKDEFKFELVSSTWGNIDLSSISTQGAWLSCEIINHPKAGRLLIMGSQTGMTYAYKGISVSVDATFDLVTDNYFNHDEGERATITCGDINNDGFSDVVIGNMSGGVRISLDATQVINHKAKLVIYPNPVVKGNFIYLKFKQNLKDLSLEVFDISGRKMNVNILEDKIDISSLKEGMYVLREKIEGKYVSSKFVVL
jgi:hypothetical protein